ncbi:type 2 periplasmic-binding domain-containing protein [Desulforegula conservatrix]|uniref:transporter substrate-binding domain-containing protein n=1 Tax=Desulforegula conservatrix TaxID=153026 RepID=UPI000428476B|nr:transporter substrate-binding domain-containing protein [Desulforegula conservatrix]
MILTLFWAGPVFSEVVKAGVISFSPYYIVEGGEVKGGVYTDILERMMERAGLKYSIQAYPVAELFSGIENGDIQIWMGTPVNGAISSPRKIAEANILVYTPSSVSPPSSIDGLSGKRVLVIDGYNYGGLLKKMSEPSRSIILDRVRSHETAFKRLSSGLERFVVDYQTPAEKTISDMKIKNLKSHILSTVDVKIYVSKKAPDPEKLMEQLMKAYEALKVEGHF